ncbi:hypothetical protein Dimus_030528 [Dionaea muscipula]
MSTYSAFPLQFLLAAQIFFCFLGSSCRAEFQEGGSDCKFYCSEPTTSWFPCHERYISRSYFTEYETLQDSSFQDFIVRLLKVNPGQVSARVLDLHRHMVGEGSHRHLSSYLSYSIVPDCISDDSEQHCEIIIIERLPPGVFADPFEYEHLQRSVFKDAAVFGDMNLELPSFLSSRSIVEVHMEAVFNITMGQKILLEMEIEIPVHARYPRLEEGGYSRIEFGAPDLLLRCGVEGRQYSRNCSLTFITGSSDLGSDAIVWSVPAGIEAHGTVVSVVTFASVILSAILIIMVSLRHSNIGSVNISKQA